MSTIDISKVRAGDVFVSRISARVRIRVVGISGASFDIETLRADGTAFARGTSRGARSARDTA